MSVPEKKELRQRILALRRSLSAEEVETRSERVLSWLFEQKVFADHQVIALYAAADGEVRTRPLFEWLLAAGRRVVLPRVRGAGPELDFFAVGDWACLQRSRRGIPEPLPEGEPVSPRQFDLVIVPGIAFDREGGRLGYGMGCYDRVLSALRPGVPRVGLGFDFQLVDKVPREAHDVLLSMVVIERGIILPPTGGAII